MDAAWAITIKTGAHPALAFVPATADKTLGKTTLRFRHIHRTYIIQTVQRRNAIPAATTAGANIARIIHRGNKPYSTGLLVRFCRILRTCILFKITAERHVLTGRLASTRLKPDGT